ncbi:hypothetical protein DW095_04210 [Bacteroides sp. AM07-16]|nr:hypothetical protein DW095_04210 [Bacteroides sp. AM07-16]
MNKITICFKSYKGSYFISFSDDVFVNSSFKTLPINKIEGVNSGILQRDNLMTIQNKYIFWNLKSKSKMIKS